MLGSGRISGSIGRSERRAPQPGSGVDLDPILAQRLVEVGDAPHPVLNLCDVAMIDGGVEPLFGHRSQMHQLFQGVRNVVEHRFVLSSNDNNALPGERMPTKLKLNAIFSAGHSGIIYMTKRRDSTNQAGDRPAL